jgi:RimJ/RimL family protein N-acetyltransferase
VGVGDGQTERLTPYRIETDRLVIRCWRPQDAQLLKDAVDRSLDHLRPWMPWTPDEPESIDTIVQRLRGFRARYDLDEDYVLGVLAPDESRVLGGTGLHRRIGEEALEIGYWIAADAVGLGYATELGGVLTRIAFELHGVDRVEIRVDPENERSERVPQKLGFVHEALLRRRLPTKHGSGPRDVNVWTMFASELAGSRCLEFEYVAYDAAGRTITPSSSA